MIPEPVQIVERVTGVTAGGTEDGERVEWEFGRRSSSLSEEGE